MNLSDPGPLIVTAHLDARSFAALDALRRRHFPARLNKIPAHVSLFHHLPGEDLASVRAILADTCRSMAPFAMAPSELRFLGRGVAIGYASLELGHLHGRLAAAWQARLTPQDRQPFRPHVTVQNKVEPAIARTLLEEMRADAEPPVCRVEGLSLWRYKGGPWEPIETFMFERGS